MDFLQRDDICNVPDNVAKLMAPYSKDWTGPKALTTQREQDPAELTREDQLYLYTAVELHHYWKPRMRALALTQNYETEYDEIASKLRDVVNVSNSLRDSVTLLNLLGFILLVGNFMNEPNKQATGFKISSLTRLGLVKDAANETTLLDFVEHSVRDKWSEWETFADDIAGVIPAQKINVDQLVQEAKTYVQNITNIQSSLDSGSLSDPKKFHPDDRVSIVVQRSMREARRKAEQLSFYLEQMQSTYSEIMAFFGEDPLDENARRNFFASFASFLAEWKKAKEKNMDIEGVRRRNEASMKRKQQVTNTQVVPDAVASPAPTGAMDDLLAKLRAAKPDKGDTRERRRRARLKERHAVRVASGQNMPELNDLVLEPSAKSPGLVGETVLTPTSETSEGSHHQRKNSEDSETEMDIADRAASLLQDIGGLQADDEEGNAEATSSNPSGSIRMSRRRQQSAAEEERARRRARRQQARSEISVASVASNGSRVPDIAEEEHEHDEAEESKETRRLPESPTKRMTPPITIVSPPSPDGGSSG
jgi:cytokinesis protein